MAIELSKNPMNALGHVFARRRPSGRGRGRRRGGVPWSSLPGVLWRRKGFLLGFVAVVLGLALAYLHSVTPLYEGEAHVMLDPDEPQAAVDVPGAATGAAATDRGIRDELLLIGSRDVAARLVDRLNLHLLPEFNPAMTRGDGAGMLDGFNVFELLPLAVVRRLPDAWVDAVLAPSSPAGGAMTDLERAELLRERIVGAVVQRIEAEPSGEAGIVGLAFRSADAELAALAANALAEAYLEERRAAREREVERTAAFLAREIGRLQESVREAEARMRDASRRYGLSDALTAEGARLEQLTTQLALARGERVRAELRLQQAQRLLDDDVDAATAAEALDSEALAQLRAREAELDRRKAELSGRYGPGHPALVELEAEEAELGRRLDQELGQTVASLREEVEAALAREAELQSRLAELKARFTAAAGDASLPEEFRLLRREAEADRARLEEYLTRAVELRALQGADEGADAARIISRAVVPDAPAYPPRFLILGVALGAALVVGVVVAFVLEQMDDTFRNERQIEEALGLPTLGLLPTVGDADPGEEPEGYVVRMPHSRFGEAVRGLRSALLLARSGSPPRVVLFTSSIPEEGKTSTAMSLARVNADTGRATLIVDCDLRRPRVHESCGARNESGLSELLRGTHTVDQVLKREETTGLSFITAGNAGEPDPAALLASERMKTTLETLCRRFELIVLDGPPVLSAPDGRVLARLADKTVFLVQWGRTRRHDAMTGIRTLTEFGANMAGVVLSRVSERRHSWYGYRIAGRDRDERLVRYPGG